MCLPVLLSVPVFLSVCHSLPPPHDENSLAHGRATSPVHTVTENESMRNLRALPGCSGKVVSLAFRRRRKAKQSGVNAAPAKTRQARNRSAHTVHSGCGRRRSTPHSYHPAACTGPIRLPLAVALIEILQSQLSGRVSWAISFLLCLAFSRHWRLRLAGN